MSINGSLISTLLNINSNNALNSLEKCRDDIIKKLQSKTGNNGNGDANNLHIDRKETFVALQGVTKQIQQIQYEKTARKLKDEWYKNESSPAKSPSKRAKIRREHESYLFNASMGKLFLAKAGISVDENVKEAKELGIEAAEVERKRKKDEMDADTTTDSGKSNTVKVVSAVKKREKKLSLNILA
ncbi:hypothetical protein [Pelosinus fermentans]|uniref:Uncharacterized protein n=1 Tax=Pelosinus fermentans JBW45 TaxID=1192197 RepID=I9NJN4_9FIRM|nr:hypothetical protein [Pelosinus fermentans]AJQ25602.1 hypothetical protein JBW_00250 [Pelosinus fermentans JBW45]